MKRNILDYIGVGFTFFTCRYLLKWALNKKFRVCEKDDANNVEYMELLSFYPRPDECEKCFISNSSLCNSSECSLSKTLKFMTILSKAEKTLDICIYLFTYDGLFNCILMLHEYGVKIRMVLDQEMSLANGSKVNLLKKNGVEVRLRKSSNVMHHKFIIIDEILFVTGSLNWTRQALLSNTEDVLLTNNCEFVRKSVIAFEKLWSESS